MLVWEDECWFSRFAQPTMQAWGETTLAQRMVLPRAPEKARGYYGVKWLGHAPLFLYPCFKRPSSDETLQLLRWLLHNAALLHKRVVVVLWDNASWHTARKVKRWVPHHNQQAKRNGQPRLLLCPLPTRSPWLNPVEPHWMHAKRKVAEPTELDLSPHLLQARVFAALPARFIASMPHYHL
jgi:hypothetical protein